MRTLYLADDPVEVLKVPSNRNVHVMAVELREAARTHSLGDLGAAREVEEHSHYRCGVLVVVLEGEHDSRYRCAEPAEVQREGYIRCRVVRVVGALEEERIHCRDAPVVVPEEEHGSRYHYDDLAAVQTAAQSDHCPALGPEEAALVAARTLLHSAAAADALAAGLEVVHSYCYRSGFVLLAQWSEVLSRLRRSWASSSRRSRCGGGPECHPPSRLCRRNT